MPGLVSLDTLRTKAKQRADMENSDFVSDTEWATYIQDSMGELFDLCIEGAGEDWFTNATTAQNTVAGTASYTLTPPSGTIYKIVLVQTVFNGVTRPIRRAVGVIGFQTNLLAGQSGWADEQTTFYRTTHKQGGDVEITFYPTPDSERPFQVIYVPSPTDIDNGSNLFQGFSGWDEYIVVDAAMKALEKEESNTQALMMRKAQLRERILHHAQTLNMGEGASIVDQSDSGFIDRLPDA